MTPFAANRQRAKALAAYFEAHGWPAAGRQIERDTNGQVSKLFVARYAAGTGRDDVLALGGGLYAPLHKARADGMPMSAAVALELLALEPGALIDDHDHLRLFKIVVIMGREGWTTTKVSRTTRGGIRRQTARVTLTETGREKLEARARLAKDEF